MIDYDLLVLQNPWWINKEAINEDSKIKEFKTSSVQYLPKNILDASFRKGAINIVSGPRQTGKSTALKLLIKKLLGKGLPAERIFYFNCDALDSRKEIINYILGFLENIKTSGNKIPPNYLFLDEISSVKDWPYAVKWLADAGLFSQSRIVLTGSSGINLKKSGEFLPGRRQGGKDIKFLPIDFADYFKLLYPKSSFIAPLSLRVVKKLQVQLKKRGVDTNKAYRNFLLTGGFLKMIDLMVKKEPYEETVELYKSTIKSELAKFGKKEVHARQILKKIIGSLTAETSYANVAEEAELGSKNTAYDYLNFFSDSFFLNEVFFYSLPQKRVVVKKNKKFYPADPFLLWVFHSFVFGGNQIESFYRNYLRFPLSSQMAELFVASELYKKDLEVFFFHNQKELDFYVPEKDLGIEVKYKEKISSQDLAGFKDCKKKVVVSKNTLEEKGDVLIIPVDLFGLIDWRKI